MSKKRHVFISSSHRDRELAETLIEELHAYQISTFSATENRSAGADRQRKIEEAVKSADAVVILIDPKREPDSQQQFEWSTALEAEWEDPDKLLIPVLLGNAEQPSFLSGRQALRVKTPKKEWRRAVEELVHVLSDDAINASEFSSLEREEPSKRRDRLRYIEEAAQALKAQER